MVDVGYFEDLVLQHFDSLFLKHGYSYFGNNESQRDLYCYFKRSDRTVVVHYNRPNVYIDITFYKETDTDKLIGTDHIMLMHIMKDKAPNFHYLDYVAIMPSKIGMHESMEKLSELTEKYAFTYLDGTEWKTWSDVQ